MGTLRVQSLLLLGHDERTVFISVKNDCKEKAHLCVFYDANNILEKLVEKGHITLGLMLLNLVL
jgi:hypothetical protein